MTFENIKTGEKVTFKPGQDPSARQAHIAAYLNSSDMSPNALKGQDFGWRLSPEIKHRIEQIKGDMETLDMLSKRIGISIDDIRDFHIVNYIAEQEFAQEALQQKAAKETTKYEEDYNARLQRLRKSEGDSKSDAKAETDNSGLKPSKDDGTTDTSNAKLEEPKSTNDKKGK